MTNLDQESSVCSLVSVDFAKAFNTMSHSACIESLIAKGASSNITRVIASFLTERKMKFRAGECLSSDRPLNGGSPQGTLLGNYLFVLTTDHLEDTALSPVRTPASPTLVNMNDNCLSSDEDVPLTTLCHLDAPTLISTPNARGQFKTFCPPSDEDEEDQSFHYFSSNRRPYNRLDDTPDNREEDMMSDLNRWNADPPPSHWTERRAKVLKYVDDFIAAEKLRASVGRRILSTNKQVVHLHAPKCQHFFNTVKRNASMIGMSVNQQKTQLLGINSSKTSKIQVYIRAEDNTEITGQEELKLLGFYFGTNPGLDCHLSHLTKKFRRRLWIIRHLKKAGLPEDDLLAMYKCFLLSLLDYAAVVYHPLLSITQAKHLEDLQASAMRIIYGYKASYAQIMANLEGKLEPLHERRISLLDRFILKCIENPTINQRWFPRKEFVDQNLRRELYYKEEYARTDRLYNSPIFFYRRRLNEIHTPTC